MRKIYFGDITNKLESWAPKISATPYTCYKLKKSTAETQDSRAVRQRSRHLLRQPQKLAN
jgi:hypothetical protein